MSNPRELSLELEDSEKTTEPALKVGAITSVASGILSLVLLFAPNLLNETQLTVIGIISAFALPIITALFTRGRVWSPASVLEVVNISVQDALAAARKGAKPLRTLKPMTNEDAFKFREEFRKGVDDQ